jgi:hypothetical protein
LVTVKVAEADPPEVVTTRLFEPIAAAAGIVYVADVADNGDGDTVAPSKVHTAFAPSKFVPETVTV